MAAITKLTITYPDPPRLPRVAVVEVWTKNIPEIQDRFVEAQVPVSEQTRLEDTIELVTIHYPTPRSVWLEKKRVLQSQATELVDGIIREFAVK